MATPRIFISSTCYDLQEIRFQLRKFVEDFGLEPVMSEFGDIFYNFDKHVQDSCKDEIEKCHLFILVIGNNYGSLYFDNQENRDIPDSVTLQEFRKALETKVYKHIFINKYVNYDYQNYKRALEKKLLIHFKQNKIKDDKIEAVANQIKKEFNETYPFPQDSYKYVFYFLDIINSLTTNNAVMNFETFSDIKDSLKKQWGGFLYEALTKQNTISVDVVKEFSSKIDRIDAQIKSIVDSRVGDKADKSKITFSVDKLLNEIKLEDLGKLQEKIDVTLKNILFLGTYPRIRFRDKFDSDTAEKWLKYLDDLIENYKWSKAIDINVIFDLKKLGINYVWFSSRNEVPYLTLVDLSTIYKQLSAKDKSSFLITIKDHLNKAYEAEPEKTETDDLPF